MPENNILPVAKGPSISVFYPCYNEAENVVRTVEKSVQVLNSIDADLEIIIVDDGSTDQTGAIADSIANENPRLSVVHHPVNRGYGCALQSGFKAACKEFVFYTDGDGQFDINEMPPLLGLMDKYDIVSCYRLNRREGLARRFSGWCWTKLMCILFGFSLRDIDCGFKLYRREIFDKIKILSTGALVDTEILARAARKGYRITQVGVHHYPRTAGKATGANIRVILRAFKELLKLRPKIMKDDC